MGLPVAVACGEVRRAAGFDIMATWIAHYRTGEVSSQDLRVTDIVLADSIERLKMADSRIIAAPPAST